MRPTSKSGPGKGRPKRTLFVDDNHSVLRSAQQFGVEMLLTVTRPDTSAPRKDEAEFAGVEGVVDLIA